MSNNCRSPTPILSLILCTVNREVEPINFIRSIWPGHPSIELIVVDQNDSANTIREHLKLKNNFYNIKYIKEKKISLSYARNIGLRHSKALYVGFPDDDCLYSNDLLEKIVKEILLVSCKESQKCRGIAISYSGCKSLKIEDKIRWFNLLGKVISFSFFIKRLNEDGLKTKFNETLGVGCNLGAGEETYYLLQALKKDSYLKAVPHLFVNHPIKNDINLLSREAFYSRGFGALAFLFPREIGFLGITFSCKILFGPALKILFAILRLDFPLTRFFVITFIHRWIGFFYAIFTFKSFRSHTN